MNQVTLKIKNVLFVYGKRFSCNFYDLHITYVHSKSEATQQSSRSQPSSEPVEKTTVESQAVPIKTEETSSQEEV